MLGLWRGRRGDDEVERRDSDENPGQDSKDAEGYEEGGAELETPTGADAGVARGQRAVEGAKAWARKRAERVFANGAVGGTVVGASSEDDDSASTTSPPTSAAPVSSSARRPKAKVENRAEAAMQRIKRARGALEDALDALGRSALDELGLAPPAYMELHSPPTDTDEGPEKEGQELLERREASQEDGERAGEPSRSAVEDSAWLSRLSQPGEPFTFCFFSVLLAGGEMSAMPGSVGNLSERRIWLGQTL